MDISRVVAYGLCEIWQRKNAAGCYTWISMECLGFCFVRGIGSDGTKGQHTIESQEKYIGWIGKRV